FKKNIIGLYGQQGQEWIDNLPKLVEHIAAQWDLAQLEPMDNLSFNYVLMGIQKNVPIILKLCFDKHESQQEAGALANFAGHSCIKLLDHDTKNNALLLERAVPGQTLKTLFPEQDKQATKIACEIIRDLHSIQKQPEPNKFQKLSDWLKIFDKEFDIPEKYLNKAKNLSTQLLATTTKTVFLHGDLHHDNILSYGPNTWVAIDPKGIIGDPVYDVGPFIRNPWPQILEHHDVKKIIHERVNFFADYFGFDKQRIIDWVYVQAILSACWAIEDNGNFKTWLELADIIEQTKQQK
ncbi:MAG: aminoglycoside phosphotransferase family protein, partial [bacterium]